MITDTMEDMLLWGLDESMDKKWGSLCFCIGSCRMYRGGGLKRFSLAMET
jgi:hypothetical protein